MEETTNAQQRPTRRRLTRRRDGRYIGGVASGLADYFDIDAWIVRVAFIALAFAGGSAIIIYILGVVALPTEDDADAPTPLERFIDELGTRGPKSLIAVIVAVLVIGAVAGNHAFWLPLMLVAIGLILFRDRWEPALAQSSGGGVVTADTPTAAGTTGVADTAVIEPVTTAAYGGSSAAVRHRRNRVRRYNPLARLTFGLALASVGVTVALLQADVVQLRAQQVFAVPLVLLGLGILAGTFYGRALRLLVPAILVGIFATAGSLADVPLYANGGDRIVRPLSVADVRQTYTAGPGHLQLDLSQLDAVTLDRPINVTLTAGYLEITVPRNTVVNVETAEGAGVIEVFGKRSEGRSPQVNNVSGEGVPTLTLHARNGFGRLDVVRPTSSVGGAR